MGSYHPSGGIDDRAAGLFEDVGNILTGTALCAVARHQEKGGGTLVLQRFKFFWEGQSDHSAHCRVAALPDIRFSPLGDLVPDCLVQLLAVFFQLQLLKIPR